MCAYDWFSLKIELHIRSFDGAVSEQVRPYLFAREQLKREVTVVLSEEGLLDYVLTVQNIASDEVVISDALRSKDEVMNLNGYESQGVLIIHKGDVHKTPIRNLSYDRSYWYEISIQ